MYILQILEVIQVIYEHYLQSFFLTLIEISIIQYLVHHFYYFAILHIYKPQVFLLYYINIDDIISLQETDVDKEVQSVTKDISQKTKASNLSSLGLLNFNALSTYVTCDSPPPIQMTADELEQLENAKIHGLPKKVEGSYVPKELR